jgi:uncharacterized protein (TIGR02996 family)
MSSEEAFLADICQHPADDAPRLVFADWLDDQGRAEQAEFIRVQCELARMDAGDPRWPGLRAREHQLLARNGKGWAGRWLRKSVPRARECATWGFRRGMVETVAVSPETLLRLGEELVVRFAIRQVRLVGLHGAGDLADFAPLRRVEELALGGDLAAGEGLRRLCASPSFPNLRRLEIDSPILPRPVWHALARRLGEGRLEHLRFSQPIYSARPFFNGTVLAEILAHPATRGLRSLEIGGAGASDHVLADLCRGPQGGQLRELTLERLPLELHRRPEERAPPQGALTAMLAGLFRRSRPAPGPSPGLTALLSGLTRLCVRACRGHGSIGLADLVALPALSRLHTLELEYHHAGRPFPPQVLTLPHLSGLTTLIIPGQRLGDAGLATLAGSPALARLTTLDVASNNLTAAAVPLLTDSPHLAGLRWLVLRNNAVGPGLRRLIESDLIGRLCWLDLRGTGLFPGDALLLASQVERLRGLAVLDLRRNPLPREVCQRLALVFGTAVRYTPVG